MNPPADFLKSSECVLVPAKNKPGTVEDSWLALISGYFFLRPWAGLTLVVSLKLFKEQVVDLLNKWLIFLCTFCPRGHLHPCEFFLAMPLFTHPFLLFTDTQHYHIFTLDIGLVPNIYVIKFCRILTRIWFHSLILFNFVMYMQLICICILVAL